MKNNFIVIIVGVIIVLAALLIRLTTPTNRWVCSSGEWIKHGEPKTAEPNRECFDEFSIDKEIKELDILFKEQESQQNDAWQSSTTPIIEEEPVVMPRLIKLISPQPNEVIMSPYVVKGLASGSWYFEASFPVTLKAADDSVIYQTYAQTKSDWMTSDLIPFEVEIIFELDEDQIGEIVFHKDNPSGLPEYDAQVSYPINLSSQKYEN